MKYESGFPFYGQKIAVLVFSTTTPRIPGDPGNNDSFNFPVRYEIIKGGFSDLIEYNSDMELTLLDKMEELSNLGIKGVVGDCGLLSRYQNVLGKKNIPFVGSSLVIIPTLWELIGRTGTIGILTGHSDLLKDDHIKNSGISNDINIFIQGLQNEKHFKEIVIEGGHHLDEEKMKQDVLNATKKLVENCNNLRAIVIECSNLGTFSSDIEKLFNVPVVDIVSVSNFLYSIIAPKKY